MLSDFKTTFWINKLPCPTINIGHWADSDKIENEYI